MGDMDFVIPVRIFSFFGDKLAVNSVITANLSSQKEKIYGTE